MRSVLYSVRLKAVKLTKSRLKVEWQEACLLLQWGAVTSWLRDVVVCDSFGFSSRVTVVIERSWGFRKGRQQAADGL